MAPPGAASAALSCVVTMRGTGCGEVETMGSRIQLRDWLRGTALAVTAAVLACAPDDGAAPIPSTTPATAPTAAATETVQTTAPAPARDLPALADTYLTVGDAASPTVVVLAQGGPLPSLVPTEELTGRLGVLDLEQVLLVHVHQAQTIDPVAFAAGDITFEEARAAGSRSVAMFAAVVDHFREQGKRVYVAGISFGAFVVQELLATRGNVAEGYLLVTGRIDMPEGIWTEFAAGRTAGFARGVEIVKHPGGEAARGGADAVFHRNSARLAAGLGHHRYSERLAGVGMANVVYVFAALDEQVGRLSEAELAFLAERGAEVIEHDGGHDIPGHVMYSAFVPLLPRELLQQP